MKFKIILSSIMILFVLMHGSISLADSHAFETGHPSESSSRGRTMTSNDMGMDDFRGCVSFWDLIRFLCHLSDVLNALSGLSSENPDDIRASLDELRILAEEGAEEYPFLYEFIAYILRYYSKDEASLDYYTRSLAVRAQIITARELGWPEGKESLESVIDILLNDHLDMMRAAAADALSEYRHTRVVGPLEYAYNKDSSFIVREISYRSLIIITNGAYESTVETLSSKDAPVGLESSTSSLSPGAAASSPLRGSDRECIDDEVYEWIKTHTLILDSNINIEELRCDIEEETK